MGHQRENAELLAMAVRAAAAGAAVIAEAAPRVRELDWHSKAAPTDFVSEVDVAAERAILGLLTAELPEAAVLAEESATSLPPERLQRGLALVVDPLDGTTNFLHGFPAYAVSIAILRDGEPVAAVVHDVPRGEVFTATAGGGAFVGDSSTAANGSAGRERLRVSTISQPERALIGTGFPFKDADDIGPYHRQMASVMAEVAGVRRPGAAALDLASVAAGRFDGFWEQMLSPWDFAAGMLLVREAGGIVTDLSGSHLKAFGRSSVLAGSAVMHRWLAEALARA